MPQLLTRASIYERSSQGYQRVVRALLDAKQSEAALNVANSIASDSTKSAALDAIVFWDMTNGRLANAREVLSSLNNTLQTAAQLAILRNQAVSSAKEGDIASALRLVGELHNPSIRRATLFAIARVLPQ